MKLSPQADPDVVQLKLKPPASQRDVFDLLTLFDPAAGLEALLSQLDLSAVSSRHVYWSVLGRTPELRAAGPQPPGYDPLAHFQSALNGEEFQNRLIASLLQAFPENHRLLFVHIPKCAGSDLTVHLLRRHPGLNQRLAERSWTQGARLFEQLRDMVLRLRVADTVFLHGHVPLRFLVSRQLIRATDEIFTVVREPVSRVISQINYILTRFLNDPELKAIDTRDWLRFLDEGKVRAAIASGQTQSLALDILRVPQLVQGNTMCHALGNGDSRTAIEQCVLSNIEITETSQYQNWLKARWGVKTASRVNASRQLLRREDLGSAELEYLRQIDAEDMRLYETIMESLYRANTLSITGEALYGALSAPAG